MTNACVRHVAGAVLLTTLAGCVSPPAPTDTNNAYLAAATCATRAGYPAVVSGSAFSAQTSVDEAMAIVSNDFSVPPSAIPAIRTCTRARIAGG